MLTIALAMIIWCLGFVFVFVVFVFVMTMIIWCLGLPDRREHGRVESKSHNWVDLLSPPCLFVIIIINQKNIDTILIIIIRVHNDDHLFWAVLSLNCVFRDDLKVKSDFYRDYWPSPTQNCIWPLCSRCLRAFWLEGVREAIWRLVSDLRLWPLTEPGQV